MARTCHGAAFWPANERPSIQWRLQIKPTSNLHEAMLSLQIDHAHRYHRGQLEQHRILRVDTVCFSSVAETPNAGDAAKAEGPESAELRIDTQDRAVPQTSDPAKRLVRRGYCA